LCYDANVLHSHNWLYVAMCTFVEGPTDSRQNKMTESVAVTLQMVTKAVTPSFFLSMKDLQSDFKI